MPIYEYLCKKCGEVTEHLVLGKAESPACKGCGSEEVVKLMSAANVGAASRRSRRPGKRRLLRLARLLREPGKLLLRIGGEASPSLDAIRR